MPEGNVIHNQARRLRTLFRGTQVEVDSPQGRFAADAKRIDGRMLEKVEAHGKHLFLSFGDVWVHVHLGLFGKWRIAKGEAPEPRGQIRMRFRNADGYAELRGPTVCELLDDVGKKLAVAKIGPDPIRQSDPTPAWERVHRSSAPIGALLMDQRVFAGVGNIYRAEVLFRHNISPYRPGKQVSRGEFDAIWDDLVVLMKQGTKRGRIDTVRPEHLPEIMGRRARNDRHGGEVYVYRRAGHTCHLCAAEVQMADMGGRKLYWCPECQPV
ncbi:MAG TPA: DNA-formamidopyrimidine glycosylase family protein [Candidatus Nanopelagicales bacterium]|nr:DNA-formamidopyrimidine glycosylase family protein [Candidatus Nanopelagicales bacterium]